MKAASVIKFGQVTRVNLACVAFLGLERNTINISTGTRKTASSHRVPCLKGE